MNLMPVMVDKSANPSVSSQPKASSSPGNNGQASEFDNVLSDSLAQQTPANSAAGSLQEPLPVLPVLPSGGDSLPPEGESLPLANLANTPLVLTEDNMIAGLAVPLTTQVATNVTTPPVPATELPPTGLVAGVAVQMSSVLGAVSPGTTGESVDKSQGQLNLQSRQGVSGALFTPQTMSSVNPAQAPQTSTGDQGLNGQAQAMPMPELTAASMEDKLDFSRIFEKGLAQPGKESASAQLLSGIDATKSGPGMLKSAAESLQMQHTIDKPKWSNELGSRMVWLSKEGVQSAQLKLTPAHLGTIDVKISIQNDQATVSFLSQHGAVRDAIESSLPRLREMMQEAGVKLDQANISNHSNAQQQSAHSGKTSGQPANGNGVTGEGEDELAGASTTSLIQTSDLSAIDFYA